MNTDLSKSIHTNEFVQTMELNHVETLESLSLLILREIESLKSIRSLTRENEESPKPVVLYDEIQRFEISLIKRALVKSKGKQNAAARMLGIKMTTLHAKIKRYNIDVSDFNVMADETFA